MILPGASDTHHGAHIPHILYTITLQPACMFGGLPEPPTAHFLVPADLSGDIVNIDDEGVSS